LGWGGGGTYFSGSGRTIPFFFASAAIWRWVCNRPRVWRKNFCKQHTDCIQQDTKYDTKHKHMLVIALSAVICCKRFQLTALDKLHRIKGIFGADHVPVVSSGHSGFLHHQN
jgi:hypothetical protein